MSQISHNNDTIKLKGIIVKYIILLIPITYLYILNLIAVTIVGHVLSHVSRMTDLLNFYFSFLLSAGSCIKIESFHLKPMKYYDCFLCFSHFSIKLLNAYKLYFSPHLSFTVLIRIWRGFDHLGFASR